VPPTGSSTSHPVTRKREAIFSNAGRSVPNSRYAISFLVHSVLVNGMSSTAHKHFQASKGASPKSAGVYGFRDPRTCGLVTDTALFPKDGFLFTVQGHMYYSGF